MPTGFTQLLNHTNGGQYDRAIISAKILDGTEGPLTGMSGDSNEMRWVAACFRPDAAIASFNFLGGNGIFSDANPAAQTITASGATKPVLLIGQMSTFWASGQPISPRSTSPAMDELSGYNDSHYVHYKIYSTSDTPVNHSYDMDDEGFGNVLQSGYLTFN